MAEDRKTKLILCNCRVPSQDAKHGEFVRVHNKIGMPLKHSNNNWRCTGCGRERV